MQRIIAVMVAVALLSSAAIAESITGWVSDEKCAAKGDKQSHADCAKKCAEAGQKLVFVSTKGHKVYSVDNQDTLKGHEGQLVRVTARDNNGTLHVQKVVRVSHTEN